MLRLAGSERESLRAELRKFETRVSGGSERPRGQRQEKGAAQAVREPSVHYGEVEPEGELLDYFLRNHEQMGTFLSTSTDGLSAEDRRKVALAILNGFKKLAIAAGERIPPEIYDIERRFVAE